MLEIAYALVGKGSFQAVDRGETILGCRYACVVAACLGIFFALVPGSASAVAGTIVVDGDDVQTDTDGCGGGAGPASDPCNTIQGGVDAASSGDTVAIGVSAHRYLESVQVNKANLTLEGPMAGVPGYERNAPPPLASEAILDGPDDISCCPNSYIEPAALAIMAPRVTVDGLAVADTFSSAGIAVKADDALIENTIITRNGPGIWVHANRTLIIANYFFANGNADRYVQLPFDIYGGPDWSQPETGLEGLTAVDNLLEGTSAAMRLGSGGNSDVRFNANTVVAGSYIGQSGVELGSVIGAEVLDNYLEDSGLRFTGKDVAVTGNELHASDIVLGGSGNVSVTGNDIEGGYDGIHVTENDGSVRIAYNRLVDNAYREFGSGYTLVVPRGIVNESTVPVAAENNWWGCNPGPGGSGCTSNVKGAVDYSPWLVLSVGGDPARLLPGRTTAVFDLRHNNLGEPVPGAIALPPMAITVSKVSGPGTLVSPPTQIEQGLATAAFESSEFGEARLRAAIDQQVSDGVILFAPTPTETLLPPASFTSGEKRPALTITNVRLSRSVWRLGRSLPRISRQPGTGTTIAFRLSTVASARLVFERVTEGRRVGSHCKKASHIRRNRKPCALRVSAGSLRVSGKQGLNSVRFEGRLSRRRALKAGRYRLTIVASDSSGAKVQSAAARFRVLPSRR